MKKYLIAFLMTIIATPSMADNWVKFTATAVEGAINTMVTETHRQATATEYQTQMDQTTGKINVIGMYKVCATAGFNINNTDGYNACRRFIDKIATDSGFGTNSATQENCKNKFNGIWTLSTDGKEDQCVGRDGHKLVYNKSCDGAGGECIRVFKDLETQEPTGREFIQAYATKNNLPLTCWYTFDKSRQQINAFGRPQDYIRCSAGGKSYEFEFNDLIQDPGPTSWESENETMCEMFGGKIVTTNDSANEKLWQSCDISRDICNGALHSLAIKTGHSTMYQGYCRLSRTAQTKSVVSIKTLDGVDSHKFADIQTRANEAKTMVTEYLHKQFPNETYINCDSALKPINDPTSLDKDYVITCTVGTKQVDFIFDDLTEHKDYEANSGAAKMVCIVQDGEHKGKNCMHIGIEKCNSPEFQSQIPGGARWDKETQLCVLNDVAYANRINNGINIATGVVVGIVVTVGTGGGALIVLTEVGTGIALDAAFIAIERWVETNPQHFASKFLTDTQNCNDAACAKQMLKIHFANLNGILTDINDDVFNEIATRLNNMADILPQDDFNTAIKESSPSIRGKLQTASTAGLFLSAFGNPQKLLQKAPRLASKLDELIVAERRLLGHIDEGFDAVRLTARKINDMDEYVSHLSRMSNNIETLEDSARFMRSFSEFTDDFPPLVRRFQNELDEWGTNFKRMMDNIDDQIEDIAKFTDDPTLVRQSRNLDDEYAEITRRASNLQERANEFQRLMNRWADQTYANNEVLRFVQRELDDFVTDFRRLTNARDELIGKAQSLANKTSEALDELPNAVAKARATANASHAAAQTADSMPFKIAEDGTIIRLDDTPTINKANDVVDVADQPRKIIDEPTNSPYSLQSTTTDNGAAFTARQTDEIVDATRRTTAHIDDVLRGLPATPPLDVADERRLIDEIADFYDANPNLKNQNWSSLSMAEDAYIKHYGTDVLDEIGERRINQVMRNNNYTAGGYPRGATQDRIVVDYDVVAPALGASDVEQNFLNRLKNFLDRYHSINY